MCTSIHSINHRLNITYLICLIIFIGKIKTSKPYWVIYKRLFSHGNHGSLGSMKSLKKHRSRIKTENKFLM